MAIGFARPQGGKADVLPDMAEQPPLDPGVIVAPERTKYGVHDRHRERPVDSAHPEERSRAVPLAFRQNGLHAHRVLAGGRHLGFDDLEAATPASLRGERSARCQPRRRIKRQRACAPKEG